MDKHEKKTRKAAIKQQKKRDSGNRAGAPAGLMSRSAALGDQRPTAATMPSPTVLPPPPIVSAKSLGAPSIRERDPAERAARAAEAKVQLERYRTAFAAVGVLLSLATLLALTLR